MPATVSDFRTGIVETGVDLCQQWDDMVRAVQSLTAYFVAKHSTGTEPNDILTEIALGDESSGVANACFKVLRDATGAFQVHRNTGAGVFTPALSIGTNSARLGNNAASNYKMTLESGAQLGSIFETSLIFRDGSINVADDDAAAEIIHFRKTTTNSLQIQTQQASDRYSAITIAQHRAGTSSYPGGGTPITIDLDGVVQIGTALSFPDGTQALPGISFTIESDLGVRRVSSALGALVEGGVDALRWTGANGGQILLQNGTAGFPSLSFVNDPNTGLFVTPSGTLNLSSDGVTALAVQTNGLIVTPVGTASAPAIRSSVANLTDSGMMWGTSGNDGAVLELVADGRRLIRGNARTDPDVVRRIEIGTLGAAATPAIVNGAFSMNAEGAANASNTGLFWNSTTGGQHYLGIAANGLEVVRFRSDSGVGARAQVRVTNSGSTDFPEYSFASEENTGMQLGGSFLTLTRQTGTGSLPAVRVGSAQVFIGNTTTGAAGSQSAPALCLGGSSDDTNTGFWKAGSDDMRMGANNTEVLRITSNALRVVATSLGFYNTAPATVQTPTGSRAGNAALASLLTALATTGLIIDGTSA